MATGNTSVDGNSNASKPSHNKYFLPPDNSMDEKDRRLFASIMDVSLANDLFFDNKFNEAKSITSAKSTTSMYHAIGCSTWLFLEAVMTFEAEDISKAVASIKESIQVCSQFRKKRNMAASMTRLFGLSPSDLTEEERHAELIFAELNLYRAALTFVQDENLVSFIRGALKIRMCYQTYNYCYKLAEKMQPTPYNMQFICGVLLGRGFFNVSLSLLPPRVISLLEWFGFTADKMSGMRQLYQAYSTPNLRCTSAALFLLSYNLFLTVHFGTHDAQLFLVSDILRDMLGKYPNGVFFHLHAGRFEQINGNFDAAITSLTKAVDLQNQWKQFSHICYWELMWCYAYKMEWDKSAYYAELLRMESNWSKLVYTFLRATFLIMLDEKTHKAEIDQLMSQVPSLQQRLAGKSLPTEKFLLRKSRKYFEQGEYLLLPAHEMLYCWSGLALLKNNKELRCKHLELINNAFQKLNERNSQQGFSKNSGSGLRSLDDYCMLQLFKGTLLTHNNEVMRAELCLVDVRENYPAISKDHYLAPAAMTDLVWIMIEQQRYKEAAELLKYVKKTYSNYSLESRFHFRMHAAQTRLDLVLEKKPST